MLKKLDQLADRSCWISGDRINACVGVDGRGLTEVGFHGVQPVSRNSRMLVREQGVLSFAVRNDRGEEREIPFDAVDWLPHRIAVGFSPWGKPMQLQVLATSRALLVGVTGEVSGCHLVATFFVDSCTTQVRGERTWKPPLISSHWVTLESRDCIRLHDWIRQKGPYAGDFLIPEQWRRVLFSRSVRSGQATVEDLRPEYRDADVPLYEARTVLRIGGERCAIETRIDQVVFSVPLEDPTARWPAIIIEGAAHSGSFSGDSRTVRRLAEHTEQEAGDCLRLAPQLVSGALPELTAWFSTVPALVRSCTVADLGMPRATPGAYYWLWAWDTMVTGMEVLRWGEYGLAENMARFINAHRDSDGSIPARWTRSGLPLDTPPRGALEFLLIHLAYQCALETGNRDVLFDVYPYAVAHLRAASEQSGGSGMAPNSGFYPDLPLAFGRTDRSIVALETGCLYGLARVLENVAVWGGDAAVGDTARLLARRIETEFLNTFWDAGRGFLVDAVDADTGERNRTYPLFSLLCLQTPLSLALVRRVLPDLARFMQAQLQTEHGTRLLPAWDQRRGSEDVAAAWYPHWDLYLLKVLRRAGEREGIMRWLQAAEQALRHLGFTPEFLKLDGFSPEDPQSWRQHGAVSNLNCVTAWYHCVLEGLLGIDFDPGGMCVVPLDLPRAPLRVRGMVYKRTRWDIRVDSAGPVLEEIRIDGMPLRGTTKIPSAFHDGGEHELVVRYGRSTGGPGFREILNAEVLESEGEERSCAVRIRALGTSDIVIERAAEYRCECDGRPLDLAIDASTEVGIGRIVEDGLHMLTLRRT